MRLDTYIISFLVFTAVVLAGTFMISDINSNYGDQGVNLSTDEFVEVFNTSDAIFLLGETVKNDTFGSEVDQTDTVSSMLLGGYSALRAVRSTFTLFGDIVDAMVEVLPIPPVFAQIIKAVMFILVTFAIIYLVFKVVT